MMSWSKQRKKGGKLHSWEGRRAEAEGKGPHPQYKPFGKKRAAGGMPVGKEKR